MAKNIERNPSEIITEFMNFLDFAKTKYEVAYAEVGSEDAKVQTFLHDMEFAKNAQERNKIGTKLSRSRVNRRKAKDTTLLYKEVYNFCTDKRFADFLKMLRKLQNDQINTEKYIFSEREFKKRVE